MSHFPHIKSDASDAQVEEALLTIKGLNNNDQLVFCTEQYSFTYGSMRANYKGHPNMDRGTFSDYQHVRASSNQIKIGLFTTPVKSWVRTNKKDEEGVAEWEKAAWHTWVGVYRPHQLEGNRGSGKELLIWDSDWKAKDWSERIAGQRGWHEFWTGRNQWGKNTTRKRADIKVVWAGGDGDDGENCLQLALEWMRKVAVGEVDVSGDMEKYGMKQVV